MLIRVDRLREEIKRYNDLIDKYEDIKIKLYSELGYVSTCWNDAYSQKFFDNVNLERIDCDELINDMKSVYDVYSYIVKNYESIGESIACDLSLRDTLMGKFNNYINEVNYIIGLYDNMDLSYISESARFRKERNILANNVSRAENLREKVKTILDNIDEIEKEVKSRSAKINIKIIQKNDIGDI